MTARELAGRTVVVTGATSGIGRAAAVGFARRGAHVVAVGRDPVRLRSVVSELTEVGRVRPYGLGADFARLDDVRAAGEDLRGRYERIDVLASNAGGMFRTRTLTADGFESTIQVNHLSGFLLAHLLRDRLAGGRLIVTSSDAYTTGRLDPDDLNAERGRYGAGRAYGASKQAGILFAAEAARRWPDVLAVSFHPGEVRTLIGRGTIASWYFRFNPLLRTPDRAADTLLWLATAPADGIAPGGYYMDRRPHPVKGPTAGADLAARLWDASAAAISERESL
ncbi:SDR family NAD(P)-dependent oxidoreductase [Nonomuraea sp. 3-1Str]|uniref:SDR family NAD(P)-dependent oxidoreductase n=1 Tax=Nonomuraea sp. 3-1Str TaxID=2929801 RepID=UPI002866FA3C|nr:SDR family NAD(P)-dependent oxidoreductase [Nonomuraea sp. 3-1Str]MDR8411827.1 SDR family NAD(P)-dependent oxidoreductase [Nonomuraea sp. 3-1Str]